MNKFLNPIIKGVSPRSSFWKALLKLMFIAFIFVGLIQGDMYFSDFLNQLIRRSSGYILFAYSIILTIKARIGVNFAIGIGAMVSQLAIILMINQGLKGSGIIFMSMMIAMPILLFLGWLISKPIINAFESSIASYIFGHLFNSIYQFLGLYVLINLLTIKSPLLVNPIGSGLRPSIDLALIQGSLSHLIEIPVFILISISLASFGFYKMYKGHHVSNSDGLTLFSMGRGWIFLAILLIMLHYFGVFFLSVKELALVTVPMIPLSFVIIMGLFIKGVKFKNNQLVLESNQFIKKDIIITNQMTIILSLIIAALGQLILLQETPVLNTFFAHRNIAMLAFIAIVIGGGNYKKVTILQGVLGTLLLQSYLILSNEIYFIIFDNKNLQSVIQMIIFNGIIILGFIHHQMKKRDIKKIEDI